MARQPEEEDYTMTPCGSLGSNTCVGVVGGKFVGQFKNRQAAVRAICGRMRTEQFYPSVWRISDHGNVFPVRLRCLGR